LGWGDDIITTSVVRRAFAQVKQPLVVGDGNTVRWSEVFEGNPKISREAYKGCYWVRTIKGNRPYIDYQKSTPARMAFRLDHKSEPGELFLAEHEVSPYRKYEGFVYIEPNVKGSFSGNKDWGFENWQKVVDGLPEIKFVQGPGKKLEGVTQVATKTIRHAFGLLSQCSYFTGTDGALHHAAAALAKRAVVVWGGLVSPKILGYSTHINLHSGTHSCGSQAACDHCKQAMRWVTVDNVIDSIRRLDEECRRGVAA